MKKFYRYLLYILPLVLCFSYYPLIKLGENETMYFELSLPLLWLMVFDIYAGFLVLKKYRRKIFTKVFGSALWWLFPFFATFSVIWSLNALRGVLTVGVMWALFLAVLCFYELRENLDEKFWKVFWRWFFGSALFVCAWCVLQSVLNTLGASKEALLLCSGCVYQMFGFPHPNGFAIEPQFMGNLLLAPIIVAAAIFCQSSGRVAATHRPFGSSASQGAVYHGGDALILALPRSGLPQIWQKTSGWLLFVLLATLFLTFSRGAIYACAVGMIFLFCFVWFRAKKDERRQKGKQILKTVAIFAVSFVFTLNLQGILAASSPTSDTYADGVTKVLSQLSLGVIDIKVEKPVDEGIDEPVENSGEPVENSDSLFDGYVAESTDTRVRLTKAAFSVWKQDFKTVMFGVGIGGAGQALFNNELSPAPREIVQNEYASLLLETGLVGISLFGLIVILAIKTALKRPKIAGMILALLLTYGVTLLFFSGLTNAMQIVLIPGLLICDVDADKTMKS